MTASVNETHGLLFSLIYCYFYLLLTGFCETWPYTFDGVGVSKDSPLCEFFWRAAPQCEGSGGGGDVERGQEKHESRPAFRVNLRYSGNVRQNDSVKVKNLNSR